MATTNYRPADLTIIQIVFNRLPFLDPASQANIDMIKAFVWEVMNELEPCFKISVLPDGAVDDNRIGMEEYYTPIMQSIIADVVAIYVLLYQFVKNAQGTSTIQPMTRFLKRAKAGESEVEWGQLSLKDGTTLTIAADSLKNSYVDSANRKMASIGCSFTLCDPCAMSDTDSLPKPILVIGNCGCGC